MTWSGWPKFVESDFDFPQWQESFGTCHCDPIQLGRHLRGVHETLATAKDQNAESMRFIVGCYIGFELRPEHTDCPLVHVHQHAPLHTDPELVKRLACVLPHVAQAKNPELRARVADLCWLAIPKSQSHGCRKIALDAYLEAAELQRQNDDRLSSIDRVERAVQLLRQLGGRNWQSTPEFDRIAGEATALLQAPLAEPGVYVPAANLLCDMRPASIPNLPDLISTRVAECRVSSHFHGAASLLAVLVRWHQGRNDLGAVAATRVEIAEVFLQEASSHDNPMVKRHFLEKAVVALREAGGQGKRVEELHKLIVSLGGALTQQAQPITGEIPIPDALADQVERLVQSIRSASSLFEAFHLYCRVVIGHLPRKSATEKRIRSAPTRLHDLIPVEGASPDGRVTHRRPSKLQDPDAFYACEIAASTRIYTHFLASLVFGPLREAILETFNPSLQEIETVLMYSPFLPIGRERIVAKGLLLGFRGDDFEGAHLLLPQLENGLRTLLAAADHISSKLDKDLLQDSHLLNHLLENDQNLVSLLGVDLVNVLRSILVHRCGSNFRNELLHGLCDERDGTSIDGLCVWALMVALVMGSIQTANHQNGPKVEPDHDPGGEVL